MGLISQHSCDTKLNEKEIMSRWQLKGNNFTLFLVRIIEATALVSFSVNALWSFPRRKLIGSRLHLTKRDKREFDAYTWQISETLSTISKLEGK